MQRVRLYGVGAALFHNGKEQIRPEHGRIDLPEHLVAQALAMGFTRQPMGAVAAALDSGDELAKLAAPTVAAIVAGAPVTVEDRAALYRTEAEEKGYAGDAVDQIVAERLRYDELIAAGTPEDEAVALVWPSSKVGSNG